MHDVLYVLQSTIFRRDGKPLPLSVHMFPVFDKTRPSHYPDGGLPSRDQSRDSSYALSRMSAHSVATVSGAIAGTYVLNNMYQL